MWKYTLSILSIAMLIVGLSLASGPVFSQGAAEQAPEPTRIEADSESGEIRFYVDGGVAAVLKADGLHVRKSMAYGGTLTDYGGVGFEDFTGNENTAPDTGKDGADAE